jgi:hypothetical protein
VLAVAVPAIYGLVCGVLLGVSAALYTLLTLLALLGGVGAGYEHADALEGAGRGVAGGMLFGTFILLGHALAGTKAKTALPEPHVVLPIVTTILAAGGGALGGALRGRHERRLNPPPTVA